MAVVGSGKARALEVLERLGKDVSTGGLVVEKASHPSYIGVLNSSESSRRSMLAPARRKSRSENVDADWRETISANLGCLQFPGDGGAMVGEADAGDAIAPTRGACTNVVAISQTPVVWLDQCVLWAAQPKQRVLRDGSVEVLGASHAEDRCCPEAQRGHYIEANVTGV